MPLTFLTGSVCHKCEGTKGMTASTLLKAAQDLHASARQAHDMCGFSLWVPFRTEGKGSCAPCPYFTFPSLTEQKLFLVLPGL